MRTLPANPTLHPPSGARERDQPAGGGRDGDAGRRDAYDHQHHRAGHGGHGRAAAYCAAHARRAAGQGRGRGPRSPYSAHPCRAAAQGPPAAPAHNMRLTVPLMLAALRAKVLCSRRRSSGAPSPCPPRPACCRSAGLCSVARKRCAFGTPNALPPPPGGRGRPVARRLRRPDQDSERARAGAHTAACPLVNVLQYALPAHARIRTLSIKCCPCHSR